MSAVATAVLVGALAASSASKPAPGHELWFLIMVVAIIPWAHYCFGGKSFESKNGFRNANIALFVFGVLSALVIMALDL